MLESSKDAKLPYVLPQEVADQNFAQWWQAMELSHAMLIAGLRKRIGPDGDLTQAYRQWYRQCQDRKWQEILAVQQLRTNKGSNSTPLSASPCLPPNSSQH